uniref:Envelope glycoprotein n=1 Tax=Haemonchus contortus TaxID=6289 RepID=A0A7I4YY33_HAECO
QRNAVVNISTVASLHYGSFSTVGHGHGWIWRIWGWIRRWYASSSSSAARGRFWIRWTWFWRMVKVMVFNRSILSLVLLLQSCDNPYKLVIH